MAKSFNSINVFEGKTIADILKEAYEKSNSKDEKILKLVSQITGYISDANTAALLIPLISSYFDVGVKNDDALLKIANVVQRFTKETGKTVNEPTSLLSEEEKNELIANAKHLSVRKVG